MSASASGAALGALLSGGLLLLFRVATARRRLTLSDRLEPYLRDVTSPHRLYAVTAVGPATALSRLVRPALTRTAGILDAVLGGNPSIRRRLVRSGSSATVEAFRLEQALWAAGGTAVGLLLALALLAGGSQPGVALVLAAAGTVAGVILRDQLLTAAVARREKRMLAEFPAIAEMLALSLAAGEGTVAALDRIARTTRGELSGEVRRALAAARSGAPLVTALEGLADRTGLPSLQRFVDGIAVAIERGTPLADVLRSQAADVREADRRRLIEVGGRKDIAMMLPVVFLVLPVTVLFALFPGFLTLQALAR
jgi:tight adherence protein C